MLGCVDIYTDQLKGSGKFSKDQCDTMDKIVSMTRAEFDGIRRGPVN